MPFIEGMTTTSMLAAWFIKLKVESRVVISCPDSMSFVDELPSHTANDRAEWLPLAAKLQVRITTNTPETDSTSFPCMIVRPTTQLLGLYEEGSLMNGFIGEQSPYGGAMNDGRSKIETTRRPLRCLTCRNNHWTM